MGFGICVEIAFVLLCIALLFWVADTPERTCGLCGGTKKFEGEICPVCAGKGKL